MRQKKTTERERDSEEQALYTEKKKYKKEKKNA